MRKGPGEAPFPELRAQLKARRLADGKSMPEIAEATRSEGERQTSATAVNSWESGRTKIPDNLPRLLRAYADVLALDHRQVIGMATEEFAAWLQTGTTAEQRDAVAGARPGEQHPPS